MKGFEHKNVLKLIDSFEIGYYFVIVTEKYERTLEEWLKNQKDPIIFLP